MGWNQTQYDTNVSTAVIPAGCFLFGGSSDTVAEDMLGKHLPSITGTVRADPNGSPISVWINPDTTSPSLSPTITTDTRGVLPVIAVPGGVSPVWADFGQGLVAIKPWDTDKRYIAANTAHVNAADPHGSKVYTDNQIASRTLLAIKTADTAIASSTVNVADPHLTIPVVANGVYELSGLLIYNGDTGASTAGDFKMQWAAPTGAVINWIASGQPASSTAAPTAGGVVYTNAKTLTDQSTLATLGPTSNQTANLTGVLQVGSTAGNLVLTWSQGTVGSVATILVTGSYFILRKLN